MPMVGCWASTVRPPRTCTPNSSGPTLAGHRRVRRPRRHRRYAPLAVATPDTPGAIQINWVHGITSACRSSRPTPPATLPRRPTTTSPPASRSEPGLRRFLLQPLSRLRPCHRTLHPGRSHRACGRKQRLSLCRGESGQLGGSNGRIGVVDSRCGPRRRKLIVPALGQRRTI